MSAKITPQSFKAAKAAGEKITMLTAYDYSTASLMDKEGIDALLVGDSLAMVMLGHENTLHVGMEEMLHHTAAVTRAAKHALVVADMPYLSYHESPTQALRNAGRFVKEAGAEAIKLEGGAQFCDVIRTLVRASIPVMGHLGLTPQSVNMLGGFKVQGKTYEVAQQIVDDARALQDAGVFSIVLECIPAKLASFISTQLEVPTIGIGSGAGCDGQVLVYQDMLGLYDDFCPKFVKRFAEAGSLMREGIQSYIQNVKNSQFPAQEHCFSIDDEVLDKLH